MTDRKDLMFINEIAPTLGVSPAALFQAGCRKEITLHRLGGRWACSRREAEAYAAAALDRAGASAVPPETVSS